MKQFILPVCVLVLTLTVVKNQASDITNHHETEKTSNHGENNDMPFSSNDINIATTHMKRLKKLIYMLSDPKFDIRDNTQTKDLERIGDAYNLNPTEMKRTERGLKDLLKKIFNKKKDEGKSKKAAKPQPGRDRGKGMKNNKNSDNKTLKEFLEELKKSLKRLEEERKKLIEKALKKISGIKNLEDVDKEAKNGLNKFSNYIKDKIKESGQDFEKKLKGIQNNKDIDKNAKNGIKKLFNFFKGK